MDDLCMKVVCGPPMQHLNQVDSSDYSAICTLLPDPLERIDSLLSSLEISSETEAAQTVGHILNTCIVTHLIPDDVESMVERLVVFSKAHPDWADMIRWMCALIQYYCTDDVTLSLFAEFEAPQMAVRGLRDHLQDERLVLAASTLLSHFNLYNIDDGITQLVKVLACYSENTTISRVATRALAEFTSYYKEIPDRFISANSEFCASDGVAVLTNILEKQIEREDIATYSARITANLSSFDMSEVMAFDQTLTQLLADVLKRYQRSAMLCCHVLRTFSNLPRSQCIDWPFFASLFNNTQSEAVAFECIHFLSSVASHVKDTKSTIHSVGCVSRVLEMMRRFPNNASIQEEACSLLSYLSFDSEVITASITDFGGLLLVLNAMRKYPDNEDLLIAACAALSGLTFNNLAGQQVVVDNGGVPLILDAMRRGSKARLQENGCLAIGTMCWNSDLKSDAVRLGGVKVIMRALELHYTSSGLVKNACRALAQIAFNCERYRDEMSSSGVIPLIIKGMEQHPNYDRVQIHGCVALSYLSWTNEGNAVEITANRGYKVVVEAIRNHPNNHEVQEHACRALANISHVSLEDSAAALEQIVAAMQRHEGVSEVQEEACRAIVTLSLVSSANKDRLFELKGAEAVVAAMRNFPRTQLVQQEACNALAHLAYEHYNLNRAVTELGGVELLLSAMRTHQGSTKVQLNGCGGLSALAFDNTVAQQQIFELGGVQCIIYAMEHFERIRMLELGCSVLGTLAWNTEIKERVAVDAIPEILKAMRTHESSPLLQKSTCRAISQFAFNSENNRQLLADAGAIPLIVNAMRSHTSTEKLIVHALKALTYLCWENTQVAEAIIRENVEEVLQQVVNLYNSTQRVYSEAVHLSKILFRKTTGSPSPNIRFSSPPVVSPVPVNQTPGPHQSQAALAPPSPPQLGKLEDQFYAAPTDRPHERRRGARERLAVSQPRGRGGGGRQQLQPQLQRRRGGPHGASRGRRDGGRGSGSQMRDSAAAAVDDAVEVRFARGGAFRGGRGGGGRTAPEAARASDDLWDVPDTKFSHCHRPLDDMNWQQVELITQSKENEGEWTTRGRGDSAQPGRGAGYGGTRRSGDSRPYSVEGSGGRANYRGREAEY